jgi:hypothetical protein
MFFKTGQNLRLLCFLINTCSLSPSQSGLRVHLRRMRQLCSFHHYFVLCCGGHGVVSMHIIDISIRYKELCARGVSVDPHPCDTP